MNELEQALLAFLIPLLPQLSVNVTIGGVAYKLSVNLVKE